MCLFPEKKTISTKTCELWYKQNQFCFYFVITLAENCPITLNPDTERGKAVSQTVKRLPKARASKCFSVYWVQRRRTSSLTGVTYKHLRSLQFALNRDHSHTTEPLQAQRGTSHEFPYCEFQFSLEKFVLTGCQIIPKCTSQYTSVGNLLQKQQNVPQCRDFQGK